ncbi:hypothetical protein [Mycobacterium sp. RTGN5]|nr:hypothetical protein [Mycobacterium sp. RTGN5]
MVGDLRELPWLAHGRRVCNETFFWPPTVPLCSVLAGAARVR